jgi:hypothetical protein
METHVYSDLWRTTVRRTRWVQSIHRKINNDNHYSDYFIKYDTYINRHASKLLDDGISTSGMSELLGKMSVRDNTYIVVSKVVR